MNENEFNVISSPENTVYPESFSTADKTLSGSYNKPVTSNESVLVKSGTVIDTYSPAAIQILSSGKTVTVENSELHDVDKLNSIYDLVYEYLEYQQKLFDYLNHYIPLK